MIRPATIEDMPELHRMGRRFFEVSGYDRISSYDPETMTISFQGLIDSGTLLTDGAHGMIGFLVFPLFFNKSDFVAQELFWWVDEDHRGGSLGVKLLKAAERTAKQYGAKSMIMLSINNLKDGKLDKLYKRLGYSPQEQSYSRGL